MTAPFPNMDLPPSPPRHLGAALPGTVVADKGLPEAERSEPLAGAAGSGSHLAGDEVGGPLLGAWLSAEEILSLLAPFDEAECRSAQELYAGRISHEQHRAQVSEIRELRAQVLDELGWPAAAQLIRQRLIEEASQ